MSSLASGQETWYVFSPSADVCANVSANIFFVFVAISSSQKGKLKMKSCKTIFWGDFQ
jgi:hypothetical protein